MKYDAVVVGAGFSGLYMLHKLKEANMNAIVIEAAEDVGGVWYWNRYPGARCDSEAYHYNFTFSEQLYKNWKWSAKYVEQQEILDYLRYVAESLNLRGNIKFSTRVESTSYQEDESLWEIALSSGERLQTKYFITGVGNISATFTPDINGLYDFKGETYHTGNWPKEESISFKGKKVGVIGTGSSGVQCIPKIAKEAEELVVFQRTPNYIIPANNYEFTEKEQKEYKERYFEIRNGIRNSEGGTPYRKYGKSALEESEIEQKKRLEDAWERGGIFPMNNSYYDILTNEESNKVVAEFVKSKMKKKIRKDELLDVLMPSHYYNAKRTITDTDYFETLNMEHVKVFDVSKDPIKKVEANGISTTNSFVDLDCIVFATGYDGITGNLFKFEINGKNGRKLIDKWENGNSTKTYLGLTTNGFPNLFFITGPQSPAVLTNIPATIERNVEWIMNCINFIEKNKYFEIENLVESEERWTELCNKLSKDTLYTKTKSWYVGSNIEGKANNVQIFLGGLKRYSDICEGVERENYKGFKFKKETI